MGATEWTHCMSAALISASDQVEIVGAGVARLEVESRLPASGVLTDSYQVRTTGDQNGNAKASSRTNPQKAMIDTVIERE
jgi:hypothetical protein